MGMNAATGRALTGIDHIKQSITDILGTPIGSRVMRRDYGSVIPQLIDQTLSQANLLRIYSATLVALIQWEPRIKVHGIRSELGGAKGGEVIIDINASLRESPEDTFNIQVPIGSVTR